MTGQFMQKVYPPGEAEHTTWGYAKDMYLNESSVYATEANRIKLYAEWRRYWQPSKPVLVEKSPRHMLMTRLLQWYFTPERTRFVVVLRHPIATVWEEYLHVSKSYWLALGLLQLEHLVKQFVLFCLFFFSKVRPDLNLCHCSFEANGILF